MPEMSEFPHGLPSWDVLESPDMDESISFYSSLFGWEAKTLEEDESGSGCYYVLCQDGKQVAGLTPPEGDGQRSSWRTYISVADAGEALEKAKQAGGEVTGDQRDVFDFGRAASFRDPTGANLGVWQAKQLHGADLVNEPGAVAWHQVNTRDPKKALDFYESVFGWSNKSVDIGGSEYWELEIDDGNPAGGLLEIGTGLGGDFPDEVHAHWMVWFAVEDIEAITEKAEGSGAKVRVKPFDVEADRCAVFTDPHGAAFALIARDESEVGRGALEDPSGSGEGQK